ncbi:MAG: cytochrome c family protein, partial [Candidatus Marinimicrobia bacterium]|nr:cytochrome c family protein [Candidatus Neomarinimicrobiota bacterium]
MKKLYLLFIALIFVVTFISGQLVDSTHPKDHGDLNARMNDYCRTCHTCEYPTATNPCLMQCARQGALFSSEYSFEAGPDIVVLERLTEFFKPVTFYHGLHASMSDISDGCTVCHHYSEKSGEIPSCSNCHKDNSDLTNLNMPSLKGAYHRQCLACHREWSHKDEC